MLAWVAEPGSPKLRDALAVASPRQIMESVSSGEIIAGVGDWPESWLERIGDAEAQAEMALQRAAKQGMVWLTPSDERWPQQLADLAHIDPISSATGAPLGLWLRGDREATFDDCIAVVGARDATSYGVQMAAQIAADLAAARLTVMSGAAFGIDAAAHRGALSMGRTIAVLAGGADVGYPRAHTNLLDRIADDGGLVVSEQFPGQTPLRSRFLSRNRLIAALSGGTLVVEAARRSGSLNTLHWADQLGRPSMAVPGPVTYRSSEGCHQAIRDGKAVLVTNAEEVAEHLGYEAAP